MNYTLRELEARFVKRIDERDHQYVKTLAEADGLFYVCPHCLLKNEGRRPGVHSHLNWFRNRGIPDSLPPGPGRWWPEGTGLDDLTFAHGTPPMSRSILSNGCGAHFYITNGRVTQA